MPEPSLNDDSVIRSSSARTCALRSRTSCATTDRRAWCSATRIGPYVPWRTSRSSRRRTPPVLGFALGETRKRLSTVERVLDAMVQAGSGAFGSRARRRRRRRKRSLRIRVRDLQARRAVRARRDVARRDGRCRDRRQDRRRFARRKELGGMFSRSNRGVLRRCGFANVTATRSLTKAWRKSSRPQSSKAESSSKLWKSSRHIRLPGGRGRA